jgi:hypothetical protein
MPPANQARQREIRVFISSTFHDMQEEREELVKQIFPQLRHLCESRGVTWGEVDLRLGGPDEAKAEGKVLPLVPGRNRALPALLHRSARRTLRHIATAEFHEASSAGSTQKFFLLRNVSNVRKLWASMTSVTW